MPHSSDRPVRILFVLAWLDSCQDTEVRMLARYLDPSRYRVDVVACFRNEAVPDYPLHRLSDLDIAVDTTPYELSFADTVAYLARRLSSYEIVISCQDVADIYPALERLRHRPPLIELGRSVAEARSGPKHFTSRYVGTSEAVRMAAAARMPGRQRHAIHIPPMVDLSEAAVHWPDGVAGGDEAIDCGGLVKAEADEAGIQPVSIVVPQWIGMIETVLAEAPKAPQPSLFNSFLMGGFECSTHRLRSGKRLDVIASIGHDTHAEADYRQLSEHGIKTVRDGLRWHLIEQSPGRYDFSSFTPMLQAARRAGVQVIWDIFHYGWPDGIDIWRPEFIDRFARYARAVARHVRDHSDAAPLWCPVNEISYMSWAGGDEGYLNPFGRDRGMELKTQLVRASIAAIHELRAVDHRARFVQCEPRIAVHHDPDGAFPRSYAEKYHDLQFQAFDMLNGHIWQQLGGDPSCLDIIGINYYMHNQRFFEGEQIDVDHPRYQPLSDILFENYARYGRPIIISETGIEGERRASWFAYVSAEVERARQRGVPVEGICLYPVANHPGWDDDRLCPNGMLGHALTDGRREVHDPLAESLRKYALRTYREETQFWPAE
ncbi:MAG: hypothetical protein ACXWKW_02060 [Asticcacaulis sp.]